MRVRLHELELQIVDTVCINFAWLALRIYGSHVNMSRDQTMDNGKEHIVDFYSNSIYGY